tara:strand:+ start:636 stop:1001 length:366 start_codon:yes stop_codon:yes gene_type:complete
MNSIFELKSENNCKKVCVDDKEFYVKVLSALDRDKFETQWMNHKSENSVIGIRPFMVAFCLSNEVGELVFDSGEKEKASDEFISNVVEVGKLPAGKVQPLFSVSMQLNGFSDQEVDDLEKK